MLLLPLLTSLSVQAIAGTEIYKHVDKDGNITFTNRRIPNAEKISLASYSRKSPSNQPGSTAAQINPLQKERNLKRRTILEKELLTEEQLFSNTQSFLKQAANEQKADNHQERVVQLRNKLFLHQRNITALKKELTRF